MTPPDPSPVDPTPEELLLVRTGTAANAVSARPDASRLMLMMVGGAGILAGIAFVVVLSWLRGDSAVRTAAAASPATAPATKAVAPVLVDRGPAPTWTGPRAARWAHDGSKTITFELQATHDVSVWMSRARPVLAVRCLSRRTEAFIMLGTSVKIEEDAYKRTLRLQWDESAEVMQQWQASESAQELFAPDGRAFVRQLTHASRLRVGFTPFNAQPVTAEFVVQGFDQFAGLVASTCGWKM